MATQRVQLTVTAQRFFDDAQNKREAVRVWSLPWKLPYWIEKWDPQNEQAKVWVKVPRIPANSSVDLYVYYGNPSAVSESDGEAVFEFFDGTVHTLNTDDHIDYDIPALTKPFRVVVGFKITSTSTRTLTIFMPQSGTPAPAHMYSTFYLKFDDPATIYHYDKSTWQTVLSGVLTTDNDCILIYQKDATFKVRHGSSISGEFNNNYNVTAPIVSVTAHADGQVINYIAIAKYAEQEPTVSVGSEESSDVPGWLYRRKITIHNPNDYDLEHFQVAIDLDGSNFDFPKANSDGSDIRITYGLARYSLPYYIETWDTSTPQAVIWIGIDNETRFFVELNPNNTTDESDPSVMSLPEATNYTLNKFERYAGGG